MQAKRNFLSIKSLIILVVMAITTLALVLTTSITLFSQISSYREQMSKDVTIFSELISRSAVSTINHESNYLEELNLKTLAASQIIENVHIYRFMGSDTLEFFASYNKVGIAPVNAKLDSIQALAEPTLDGSSIEIIRPIKHEGQLLGYVYLRASAEELDKLIARTVGVSIGVLLLSLLLCFLLTLKLQSSITLPINNLVALVQRISRKKDYSGRAQQNGIKELDILGGAFNTMMKSTQEHIQRQIEAEEEHRKLNINLEEKVTQRTLALKEANSELIQTLEKLHQFQRQMVQNEKMASLGDMVAGVAHEVNTPIGLGVTASTMMLDRLAQMEIDFKNKTLKASSLSKFIEEGQENLNIIYRNLNRAAELISSFKQVAVDQSSEINRVFCFSRLMDDVLLSLRPKLKNFKHKINIHCSEDLYIESKAGPINQIMLNMIMNSIIHGFEKMEQGTIDIYIDMVEDKKISIVFKDNGSGIPAYLRKKIFDPFVTTKRGQGGSGLGLHLVYNLVTQGLNGSIALTSEDDVGVEFKIFFPAKKVSKPS
ncbi:MAG: signal transduction histidine kinase [Paraglaciecola sp.]|jgi:signal transduction histidine kinase